MHVDEIRDRVRKYPFEPFRLFVSDGSSYDVLHHDFVLITRRKVTVAIGVPSADDYPIRTVDLDPLHITQIEDLKPGRNGGRARRPKKKRS